LPVPISSFIFSTQLVLLQANNEKVAAFAWHGQNSFQTCDQSLIQRVYKGGKPAAKCVGLIGIVGSASVK
jgi:hypothetical protein